MDFSGIIHAVRDYNSRQAAEERPGYETAEVHEEVLKEQAAQIKAEGDRHMIDRLRLM